ncbi:abortive infection system antitoxin AbiGi family protein [Aliarcobacter butzleri]|uniref:abortive infection system antitoxin AbiGi family protein n=1 Tax=Aliarcobacter butzleri TaxID=28197 RepID=UPI0012699019|nr:abortive infection system antitoxin AbiGi family protein [Aliarcobacter butzleri]
MAISPSSIIHFTNKKESLIGILTNNFKLSYCKEKIILKGKIYNFGIPMVSFCDIPLSQIKEHISKYGSYGIGLKKEWAIEKSLNPVLYVDSNSNLSGSYIELFEKYLIEPDISTESANSSEKAIIDIFRYTKNYQANLEREGTINKNYRFSDEREWRYVLELSESEKYVCTHDECNNIDLSQYLLTFEPEDIQYIIIKDEEEISEFLQVLRNAKGKNYSLHDVERLMTRIITVEQINNDF